MFITEKYGINTRKLTKDIDTPFPNEIYSFGCTLRCRLLLMLRNTTDVFRKTMNFKIKACKQKLSELKKYENIKKKKNM
jgi:hypothetical protein